MSRLFYHVMQDNAGNLLFGVTGTMRLAGTGTLATLYGDEALTVPIANPLTNHPSFGSFKCYLGASAAGYDFYMAKAGYTFETLTGVQGLGTMAQQDASAVAITGGSATLGSLNVIGTTTRFNTTLRGIAVPDYTPPADDAVALYSSITAGASKFAVFASGTAQSIFVGPVAFGGVTAPVSVRAYITFPKDSEYGLVMRQSVNDTGPGQPIRFLNTGGTEIGGIYTTASATSYNTASDARLKHAIAALTGALDVIRALRPVAFRWNADDTPGVGFLAHELQHVVPDAVSGQRDAVNEDGSVKPQQVDYAKLVPHLVACCQELAAQGQSLRTDMATLAATARTNRGLGTLAQQDASAVAITGGSATGLSHVATGTATTGGQVTLQSRVGIQLPPAANVALGIGQYKGADHCGVLVRALDSDASHYAMFLANVAGTGVGSIIYNATTTTYNTTSDARLKHRVAALTGALDVVQALRPVSFLWNADGSPGVGFLASEVAQHVQGVVTGDEDAVDEHGGIVPQMIDYSKLVPFLVGAIKTMTARLVVLEDALGV